MKTRLLAALVVCFSVSTAIAQNFTVGTATAGSGQKSIGTIEVPSGRDAAASIPVAVFHGSKPGPVLALVSGLHGTEYASIIALEKVIESLDPAQISGTVIVLPLVNIPSFEQKVPHVNPVDGKSMNRYYPGNPNGSQTDRVSWAITKQVVERCDYLIDFHGGDLDENLRSYAYWPKSGDAKHDAITREMVLAFGLDHIIVWSDRPKDPNASRYLDNTANTRGKPAIAVEAGYSGTVRPEDVQLLVNGTLSVMRYLKMLPGEPTSVEHPVWIGKIDTVESSQTGVFYPLVQRGTYVAQGTKLGYVTDFFGRKVYEAESPAAGVVLYICGVPSMKKGDTVANIGEITTNP
jgi:predicted deacylase